MKCSSLIIALCLMIFPVVDTSSDLGPGSPAPASVPSLIHAASQISAADTHAHTVLEQLDGSWVYLDGTTWKNARVLTVDETTAQLDKLDEKSGGAESLTSDSRRALYLESSTDNEGFFSFSMYEGSVTMHKDPEILQFTGQHQYQLTEGEDGFAQDDREVEYQLTGRIIHDDADGWSVRCVEIDGLQFQPVSDCLAADCPFTEAVETLQQPETAFLPFLNLTISAAQSQLEGFGSSGMTDYWKNPVELPGLEGSVKVELRSSGKVMLFFPKLPVWVDFVFDDYSVIDEIRVSGTQTTFSRNTKGDGYLFGTLKAEGIGSISYGSPSGEGSIIIENGTTSSGSYAVEIAGRKYSIPVR